MPDGRDRRGNSPDPAESRRPAAGGARQGGQGRPGLPGGLDGLGSLRTGPMLRWMGAMPTRTAVLVLVAAALVGVVLSMLTGHDPGFVLGFFVVVGAVVATLGVRRGSIHLFFPLPALILFLASIMIGAVHDRALASAGTGGLGAAFLQWVAAAFFPMCIATVVTLAIGGGRWLLGRQLVTGNFAVQPRAGQPGPAGTRPAPGARRPAASDPWAEDAPRSARQAQGGPSQNGTSPRPAAGAPWQDSRRGRDQRTSRDPWGDPRLPSPPPAADPRTRPAPQFQPRDRTAPRPGQSDRTASRPAQGDRTASRQGDRTAPGPGQSDRTASRPAQGDPWDPSARPVRPPRPPRDPRDER